MKNRLASAVIVIIFASLSIVLNGQAQQEKEELKVKLIDLKQGKLEMTKQYNSDIDKVNRESDDAIAKFKKDYRISREACLENKRKKSEDLRKDYEAKLRPMLKEEADLTEKIGRDAREDFVKVRTQKAK